MGENIIVFSPHPDDETLGCGGTIAKRIIEGYHVYIIELTDGRYAFSKTYSITLDPTPENLGKIRRKEAIEAAAILGVPDSNLFFLDFEDGTLGKYAKELEEKIAEILERISPVEVYFPFSRDSHPDHQTANRIISKCCQNLRLKTVRYQYSIMHKLLRVGPFIERCLDVYKDCIVDIDISEYLTIKRRATEKFKSEIEVTPNTSRRPIVKSIDRYFNNVERFYIEKS
jgi:LmbE family N-acetylglucosaminyl deacetylase